MQGKLYGRYKLRSKCDYVSKMLRGHDRLRNGQVGALKDTRQGVRNLRNEYKMGDTAGVKP